jgi:hypothetical protein
LNADGATANADDDAVMAEEHRKVEVGGGGERTCWSQARAYSLLGLVAF